MNFLEKSDRELGVLKSLGRRLFTRPGRALDGHFEQRGIFLHYVHHRVISPTRIAMLLLLAGTVFVGSKMIPETSLLKKSVSEKTPAAVLHHPSVNREVQEIPNLSGNAVPETETCVITLQHGDTLWKYVSEYLAANNLPCADRDIQRVIENFLANYPDIDDTRIPARSSFQIVNSGGVVSLIPAKR